jgi:alanine dehydrogenase
MSEGHRITVGFPRMHREGSERRDFLPPLIGLLAANGAEVYVESGIGSDMGYTDLDYSTLSPDVHVTDEDGAYRQDIVVVLRAPEGKYDKLQRGQILVSMLHFSTRPARVRMLEEMGIDAISLDLIRNDDGRRLVENLRSVAWNGISSAFSALERTWPELGGPRHSTVKVLIMGAGRVGRHAVEFSTKFGDDARNERMIRAGLPGVEVVTAGRNLTGDPEYLKARLLLTDLLVDATARRDPSSAIIPNAWLALLPKHAVICDLAVDPYLLDAQPRIVRAIEGIPQGDLDQWEFAPEDPAWDRLPAGIPTDERRTVVTCYSWPGVRPEPCMHVYGSQLAPLLEALVTRGGMDGIRRDGPFHERALWRGSLRGWRGDEGTVDPKTWAEPQPSDPEPDAVEV